MPTAMSCACPLLVLPYHFLILSYNLSVGMNLFGAALVYFFLYETEGLTLEAVDIMYSDPKVNARNSKDWVPAGYRDRKTRIDEYFADDATRVGSEDLARGKPVVKPTKGNGGHVEKV